MSKKRVLLGLSIIAGGVCASLPFRRETPCGSLSQAGVTPSTEAFALFAQPLAPPGRESSPTGAPSPYLDDGSQRGVLGSLATSQAEEIQLPREQVHSPPMLPVSFQVKEPELSRLEPWQPVRLAEGPAGPPREYRIRKLDTLEDLAERFLGSRERAEELFEANRGVLHDRHILPLGAVLRIPAGSSAPAERLHEDSDLQPVRPGS